MASEQFDSILKVILGEISIEDEEDSATLKQDSVFTSHSWEDKTMTEKLESALEQQDIAVWIDHVEMRAGDSISDRIRMAIKMSKAFVLVLLWSGAARESHWVYRELSAAIGLNKTIVPCRVDHTELPAILAGTMAIDFHRFEFGLNKLTNALSHTALNNLTIVEGTHRNQMSRLRRIWQIIRDGT